MNAIIYSRHPTPITLHWIHHFEHTTLRQLRLARMKTYFGTIEQLQNHKFPEKLNQPKINHSYNKTIAKAQFSKQRSWRYSQKYIFLIIIKEKTKSAEVWRRTKVSSFAVISVWNQSVAMFSEEREDKFERRSTPTYILPIYYTILFDAKVRDLTTKLHTYTYT